MKKQSLIELYLNKDINRADFIKLNEKLNADIATAEREHAALASEEALNAERDKQLQEIDSIVKGIISGDIWDEIFYRHILDKIVAAENGVLNIHLHFTPYVCVTQ